MLKEGGSCEGHEEESLLSDRLRLSGRLSEPGEDRRLAGKRFQCVGEKQKAEPTVATSRPLEKKGFLFILMDAAPYYQEAGFHFVSCAPGISGDVNNDGLSSLLIQSGADWTQLLPKL